ncbi:HigA family addiction module antitoxin [Sinimarinibacterium flocculans]|uniref:Addiction module HigA family antidote n=1 Tax=Sinimarinibacterium flocculans TaxID=985250 RepID=A0A318E8T7_9GAMM|nr:HigA family addiction module antitoxin [Sinimarinibacterium flocculans]PXV65656.1 addiction module HigA family antidote [Sinimarinibacterium flocculans]
MHPGRLLQKLFLTPMRVNQSEAARRLGISRRRLHEVVHGRRRLTPDTAVRCAMHFGGDAEFWLQLQAAHDGFVAWQRLHTARR